MTVPRLPWVRDLNAGRDFEVFLVTAVATVLIVRFALRLTGYPQLGGTHLHVAHVLWGGLLMAAAILTLVSFAERHSRSVAVIVGGVGFGLFVDEAGKFLTHDNDYFFRPAVAVIYVTFVALVLAARSVQYRRGYRPEEYLVGAMREMEELAIQDLDENERRRALQSLDRSDPRHPLVPALRGILVSSDVIPASPPSLLTRLRRGIHRAYGNVATSRAFTVGLDVFFAAQVLVRLVYIILLVFFARSDGAGPFNFRLLAGMVEKAQHLNVVEAAELVSSLVSAAFVVAGIMSLRRSRLAAFRWFRRSVLLTILVTQVFVFYEKQFAALAGLAFNILLLVALDLMIEPERARRSELPRREPRITLQTERDDS